VQRADLILSIGGGLQLAAVGAALYEVGVAYAKLQDEPLWRVFWGRARRGWERIERAARGLLGTDHTRAFQDDVNITSKAEVTLDELMLSVQAEVQAPSGNELDAIRQRLDRLERARDELAEQIKKLEGTAGEHSDEIASLKNWAAALGRQLDEVTERLERLIAAASAGHGPVRLFIAGALTLGIVFVTWPQGVADSVYGPALVAFALVAILGVYAAGDLWHRRHE
jgi:hypothetical protein